MKVSVLMVTYNHERYIAEAIESVLMQVTNFDYEIVIGEDCSTDRTREIVLEYQKRFPDKIRLLLQEVNTGGARNFSQTLESCVGEYIALLDGDDYWTSTGKLQEQAEFLDAHPECSMCFHPVRVLYEDDDPSIPKNPPHNTIWPQGAKDFSTIEDIIGSIFIHTSSAMLRNGLVKYPDWLYALRVGDWPLFILWASHGDVGCIRSEMSVYRNHFGGIWYTVDVAAKYDEIIRMYHGINTHLEYRYAKIIRRLLADYYFRFGLLLDQAGDWKRAKHYIGRSLATQLRNRQKPRLNEIKMMTRFSFPHLHAFCKRLARGWAHNPSS